MEMHNLVQNVDVKSTDLILMGAYYWPVFKQLRPDLYNSSNVIHIGWGKSWGEPFLGEAELNVKEKLGKSSAKYVLVIASSLEQFRTVYPEYAELLFRNYKIDREDIAISSQSIWCGYFVKKSIN